jgi:hypothetical protein
MFYSSLETQKTNLAAIAELPPFIKYCYYKYDVDNKSNDLVDMGHAEGEAPINLK